MGCTLILVKFCYTFAYFVVLLYWPDGDIIQYKLERCWFLRQSSKTMLTPPPPVIAEEGEQRSASFAK